MYPSSHDHTPTHAPPHQVILHGSCVILGPAEPNNPAFVYISARTFLFMLAGLLYVMLLLTSLCFCFCCTRKTNRHIGRLCSRYFCLCLYFCCFYFFLFYSHVCSLAIGRLVCAAVYVCAIYCRRKKEFYTSNFESRIFTYVLTRSVNESYFKISERESCRFITICYPFLHK